MSTNRKDTNTVYWASCSVLLFILGAVFMASLKQTPFKNLGLFLVSVSSVSLFIFFVYAAIKIIFSGDKSFNKVFISTYLSISFFLMIGGVANALIMKNHTLLIFFIGLGMTIFFWIVVLLYYLFKKDN